MSPFDPARWPARLPERYWLGGVQVPAMLLDTPALPAAPPVHTLALLVERGRIAAIEARAPGGAATFDLDGAFALPAFVDIHTHLDKGDLLAAGLGPERDLFTAVDRVRADYARWTETELRARIGFALRTAFAHGTRAINTYIDWPEPGAPEGPLAWRVMRQMRQQWAGRVDLHVTSLASIDRLADAQAAETLARHLAAGGGALGLFVYPGAPLQWLPRAFDLALRHGLALDFHVDEHLDPPAANIGHVARLARERGFGRRTVCGHACVLGALPEGERDRLLDEVAASGLTLVSLPYTNLYLQDNGVTTGGTRRTPRRRGLLPWHEARARGIPLALASDNHRDVFFPGGDLDLLQALALAANAAQLDDALGGWADTLTTTPARFLGSAWDGRLRVGAPADLVLHAGRTSAEVLSRPQFGRQVLRAGQRLAAADATPPDFRELSRELQPQRPRSFAQGLAAGTAPRAAA
ncbi:MAG: amidohydrolase family protein [Rubrivivax sp.]|nr:amidohydrolase family protein [Rubrivivax sp.]